MANEIGIFRRILGGVWRTLDRIRKFIHMVLLFGMALIVLSAAAPQESGLPEKGALLLAPQGALVEQLSGDPLERAIGKAQGQAVQETLVRDLVDALGAAKDDDRVNSLVMRFDAMGGAGLSKLERLAAAIEDFKTSVNGHLLVVLAVMLFCKTIFNLRFKFISILYFKSIVSKS